MSGEYETDDENYDESEGFDDSSSTQMVVASVNHIEYEDVKSALSTKEVLFKTVRNSTSGK